MRSRLHSLALLPCALLMALPSWLGVLRLPVVHAHGGQVHSHADGTVAHSHSPAAEHRHLQFPALAGEAVEQHRREHELMARDDILRRMVPVGGKPPEQPQPRRAPLHVPVPDAPAGDPSWCSLLEAAAPPAPTPALEVPASIRAAIAAAPASRPLDTPGTAASGRAPPAWFSPHR